MKKWRRYVALLALIIFLVLTPNVWAQTPSPTPAPSETVPVLFDGQELFQIPPSSSLTAEERARLVVSRLEKIANNEEIPILVTQRDGKTQTSLRVGEQVVVTIFDEDAERLGKSRTELAQQYEKIITQALEDYRRGRSPERIIRGVIYTVLATLGWLIFYQLMRFTFGRTFRHLDAKDEQEFPRLNFFNFDLFPPARTKQLTLRVLRRTHWLIGLIAFYFYLAFVFRQFVWTQRFGISLINYVLETLLSVWQALVDYLPNLINIAVTVVIVYYTLQFLRFIANQMQAGELQIPGFYADWIQPTFRLIAFFIIALAFMIVVPFLPGFQSPAFQGVSIFIGLVVSLGSTETVTNIVAGIILIYSRAFQIGNIVKIREVMGMVEEKS